MRIKKDIALVLLGIGLAFGYVNRVEVSKYLNDYKKEFKNVFSNIKEYDYNKVVSKIKQGGEKIKPEKIREKDKVSGRIPERKNDIQKKKDIQKKIEPRFVYRGPIIKNKFSSLEKQVQDSVNKERVSRGLDRLIWNDYIADVAREHSYNLVLENPDKPKIMHEGHKFGLYQKDRLNNRGLHYFKISGENLFLMPKFKERVIHSDGRVDYSPFFSEGYLTYQIVDGWMNSEGHRRNILEEEYNEAGVGIFDTDGYFIVTHVFIGRVNCGYKDASCCTKDNVIFCYELRCNNEDICE